jgi:predicted nuclease of restriction endonuclease-like (RecB) superfamily
LKAEVRAAQVRAHRVVNTELLRLYWTIGRTIIDQQAAEDWGTKVIGRLADDLRREFPETTGLSRSNLHYMRQFAEAWPGEVVQQPVGQLPWGHVTVLLGKVDDQASRDWHAAAAVEHGWSRNVLANQIANRTHERVGAPTNFADRLPAPDSELAQHLSKDPYVFDFLGFTGMVAERDLEQAIMGRIQHVLLEFGRGFAFVGRQVHLDIDGDDFYIDLLFFHTEQLRYVVVELKVGDFEPEFAGKLNFYIAAVDDLYRLPQHAGTVGILLCAGRNERVVQYALKGQTAPMAVSTYTYETLPAAERALLPAAADIIEAVEAPIQVGARQLTLDEAFDEFVWDPGERTGKRD